MASRARISRSHGDSAGFSLVEALVSSFLLLLAVSQSLSLFGTTMSALGKARLRDSLNAAIHANLEQVRHDVESWQLTASNDGLTTYTPNTQSCADSSLASLLLAQKRADNEFLDGPLDLSQLGVPLQGLQVNRTITILGGISSATENGNLLEVRYATPEGSLINVERKAVLVTPAQGWCS